MLFWSHGQLQLDNTPFAIAEIRRHDCQFGQRYYKEKMFLAAKLCDNSNHACHKCLI